MEEHLILELHKRNCIKTGHFRLKNGDYSPLHIDLKNIISYPYIINTIIKIIYKKIKLLDFDRILGISYGALPVASILSANYNYPMILVRKETKKYGLKKLIEGEYKKHDKIIIIQDTISTGSSIKQFLELIKPSQFEIVEIIVICDRRKNFDILDEYSVRSIFRLETIISVLNKHKLIKNSMYSELSLLINNNNKTVMSNNNVLITKLIKIISEKGTNNCIVLDYTDFSNIIKFIKLNHYMFCVLKIHSEIIENFSNKKGLELKQLASRYNFLIFEGKYFNYEKNIFLNELTTRYKYYEWVDIINICIKHDLEVFNTIKYINVSHNKTLSVVYSDNIFNKQINSLLKDIIIGTTQHNFNNLFVFTSYIEKRKDYNYINCIQK